MASRFAFGSRPTMQHQVTVRVPASTSNLGPGFDCLGVALRVHNDVTVSRGKGGRIGEMARVAGRHFFKNAKLKPFAFLTAIHGEVPRSRGLGSSVTVRLGVLQGLNELAGRPLERRHLFEICAELEGHPDNAAPACYGGFNVVRGAHRQTFTVAERLHFVLLVPDFEVATNQARGLLPARIERLKAVENSRNACAITAAFASRDYHSLRGAFADHLHQPFREKLIPFLNDVIAAAESAGALGAFLSGSGSSICAITLGSADKVARVMLAASQSPRARTVITAADNRGARLLPIENRKSKIENSHPHVAAH